MKFLNKRGGAEEMPTMLLIGLVIGGLVAGIIIFVVASVFIESQKTTKSFDELIVSMGELEDGETTEMLYFLPESYALVGFSDSNFGSSLAWGCPNDAIIPAFSFLYELTEPEVCKGGDCLCACKRRLGDSILHPGACTDRQAICKKLDLGYEPQIIDPKCSYGGFMPGTASGVFELSLERSGDQIFFCREEGCLTGLSESQKAFVELESTIESARDQATTKIDYTLTDRNALVAFGADDFGGNIAWGCPLSVNTIPHAFTWQIRKPDSCGDKPCICHCAKRSTFDETVYPGACEEASSYCTTIEVGYDLDFSDPQCSYGPFKVGDGEELAMYVTRNGNDVSICTDPSCYPAETPAAPEDNPFGT